MCLAVPGTITSLEGDSQLTRKGVVDFGGVMREINLAFIEDARIGDWVLVHAGVAISKIDEYEAEQVNQYLSEMLDDRADAGETEERP